MTRALLLSLLTPLWSSSALAVPLLQPLIEITPVSEVIGDGSAVTHMHVVALFKDGQPIAGMVLKPGAKQGRVTALDVVAPGLYHFGYVPPDVDKPTEVTITVKGKTPDKRLISLSQTVMIQPKDPTQMTGQRNLNTLSFEGGHLDGDLEIRASNVALQDAVSLGDGLHKVRFETVAAKNPGLSMVTAVSQRGLSETVGYVVIAQEAQREQSFEVAPGSHVLLTVGSQEYGPRVADAKGRVRFAFALPPGVVEGTLSAVLDRVVQTSTVVLENPETKSLLLFPLPENAPADPALRLSVRALVLDATGQPDGNHKPTFQATSGSFGEATHQGDGIYRAEYTPGDAGEVTVTATLGSDLQSDSDACMLLAQPEPPTMTQSVSHNPVAHVVVLPTAVQIRSDGMSTLAVKFVTVDHFGAPVANVAVHTSVVSGGGQIPETVTTDSAGVAELHYTSGNTESLVRIRATAGDGVGMGAFVQLPDAVSWTAMPVSGQAALQAIERRWVEALAANPVD